MKIRRELALVSLSSLFLAIAGCDNTDAPLQSAIADTITLPTQSLVDAGVPVEVLAPDFGIPTDMVGNGPACAFSDSITCIGDHQGRSLVGGNGSDPFQGQFSLSILSWATPGEHPAIESAHFGPNGLIVQASGRSLAPRELIGLRFNGKALSPSGEDLQRSLTIVDAADQATLPGKYLVEDAISGLPPTQLCGGRYALVMPGIFLFNSGAYNSVELAMGTFVCADSAAGKAILFGFAPNTSNVEDFGAYAAATIMTRADYCGTNVSHTVDGTKIMHYDLAGRSGRAAAAIPSDDDPPDPRRYYLEAAWTGQDRNGAHAICLSKLRWQSIPPLGFCGGTLPDPRINRSAKYCEDLGQYSSDNFQGFLERLTGLGALVFSSSQYNDVGLWNWQSISGTVTITTTRGFWGGSATPSSPPIQNADINAVQFVAVLRTAEDPGKTAPLRLYKNSITGNYRSSVIAPQHWCAPASCAKSYWSLVPGLNGLMGYVYTAPELVPPGLTPVAIRSWSTVQGTNIQQAQYILLPDGVAPPSRFQFGGTVVGYGIGQ